MADVLVQDDGSGNQGFVGEVAPALNEVLTSNNDTGNVPIVAKDGEIIRASVAVDPSGKVTVIANDAAGVMAAELVLDFEGGFAYQNADGSAALTVDPAGVSALTANGIEFSISAAGVVRVGTSAAGAKLEIAADGAITIQNDDQSGIINIGATGIIGISPTNYVELAGPARFADTVRMSALPTADPVEAGALWVDTAAGRVVKASAG